jgi:8-amino-7-oxononanoate synthase
MDGDFAPLADYAELCRKTDTVLIVDEAHAVGIYGSRGSGMVEQTGIKPETFVTVNTAGKALGVCGAFVAGPRWAVDYLIQKARPFIFSTAPPPAVASALEAGLALVEQEPERRRLLLERSRTMRHLLAERGMDIGRTNSQIIPIVLGDNERACRVAAELQKEGFDVRAVRPPAVPAGTARLRVSINAGLDEAVLIRFVSCLENLIVRTAACSAVSS